MSFFRPKGAEVGDGDKNAPAKDSSATVDEGAAAAVATNTAVPPAAAEGAAAAVATNTAVPPAAVSPAGPAVATPAGPEKSEYKHTPGVCFLK